MLVVTITMNVTSEFKDFLFLFLNKQKMLKQAKFDMRECPYIGKLLFSSNQSNSLTIYIYESFKVIQNVLLSKAQRFIMSCGLLKVQ